MAVATLLAVLHKLDDEALVARSQAGDREALAVLLGRYRPFARAKSRSYFLVGADAEDLEQECLIGVYKATRDFLPDRQPSFRAFAELCMTRQVISAIKAASRQKHQPLNRYVSISGPSGGDEAAEHPVEGLLEDHRAVDPADEVVTRERFDDLRRVMAESLSGLEVDVLSLYVSGRSYQEIGACLGRHAKSIDNALQRVKRKLDGQLGDADSSLVA